MESAGAVFLPLVNYNAESHTANMGYYGEYWSSTPNGEYKAYCVYLYGLNNTVIGSVKPRHVKCSV